MRTLDILVREAHSAHVTPNERCPIRLAFFQAPTYWISVEKQRVLSRPNLLHRVS